MKLRLVNWTRHALGLCAAGMVLAGYKAHAQDGTTLANAIPLGSIGVSITRTGTLKTDDPVDYYRFKVEGSVRAVRVLVPAAVAPNAHVRLLTWPGPNADPIPLAAENSNGGAHADFTTDLAIGNYFVEVSSASQNPPSENRIYELQMSQTLPPKTPPFVMTALEHVTVKVGLPAELKVFAEGSGTLSYQWHFNGAPLSGATLPQLRLTSVHSSDAGSYTVTVTSEFGSVTSTAATLTVTPPSLALEITPAMIISWPVAAEGIDISQWILDRGSSVTGAWTLANPAVRTIANERVHFAVPVEKADTVLFRLRRP